MPLGSLMHSTQCTNLIHCEYDGKLWARWIYQHWQYDVCFCLAIDLKLNLTFLNRDLAENTNDTTATEISN